MSSDSLFVIVLSGKKLADSYTSNDILSSINYVMYRIYSSNNDNNNNNNNSDNNSDLDSYLVMGVMNNIVYDKLKPFMMTSQNILIETLDYIFDNFMIQDEEYCRNYNIDNNTTKQSSYNNTADNNNALDIYPTIKQIFCIEEPFESYLKVKYNIDINSHVSINIYEGLVCIFTKMIQSYATIFKDQYHMEKIYIHVETSVPGLKDKELYHLFDSYLDVFNNVLDLSDNNTMLVKYMGDDIDDTGNRSILKSLFDERLFICQMILDDPTEQRVYKLFSKSRSYFEYKINNSVDQIASMTYSLMDIYGLDDDYNSDFYNDHLTTIIQIKDHYSIPILLITQRTLFKDSMSSKNICQHLNCKDESIPKFSIDYITMSAVQSYMESLKYNAYIKFSSDKYKYKTELGKTSIHINRTVKTNQNSSIKLVFLSYMYFMGSSKFDNISYDYNDHIEQTFTKSIYKPDKLGNDILKQLNILYNEQSSSYDNTYATLLILIPDELYDRIEDNIKGIKSKLSKVINEHHPNLSSMKYNLVRECTMFISSTSYNLYHNRDHGHTISVLSKSDSHNILYQTLKKSGLPIISIDSPLSIELGLEEDDIIRVESSNEIGYRVCKQI